MFALDEAGFSAGGYLAVMVQACALATWWNELQSERQKQQLKQQDVLEEPESQSQSQSVSAAPAVLVSESEACVTKTEHGVNNVGNNSHWKRCICSGSGGSGGSGVESVEGAEYNDNVGASMVSALYKTIWSYAQPLLFMLIGAQVLLRDLSASSLVTAVTILLLATSVRLLVTYLSVSTSPVLVTKERLFVCLAWLPKATVQVREVMYSA